LSTESAIFDDGLGGSPANEALTSPAAGVATEPALESDAATDGGLGLEVAAESGDDADGAGAGGWPFDIPPPTSGRDEEAVLALFRRLRGPRDQVRFGDRESLRDHLVLVHAPLVEHCARGFTASGEPLEDLVQQGYLGLIKAVDRYDPDKGVRFSTYACHLITGEIRHYLRDLGKLIHEPGWHFELRQRISRANDQLMQKLSRPVQPEEIARALGVRLETVQEVLKNQQVLTVESLDEPTGEGEEFKSGGDWIDEPALSTASSESRVDDRLMLRAALPQLKDLEKRVVSLFFFEERSKTEIAKQLGISVNYAAYLVKRGLEHLRQIIEAGETLQPEMLGDSAWPQQRARAAYLLELALGGEAPPSPGRRKAPRTPRTADRRTRKVVPPIPPPRRRGVATFQQFVAWLDEEVQRAGRYAQEFAVLWLQIANWHESISDLDPEAAERALGSIEALALRHCRSVDKVAVLPPGAQSGLNFVILMPHTGVGGGKVGERWLHSCRTDTNYLADPNAVKDLVPQFAFACFPGDGKSSEELLRSLAAQLPGNKDDD